MKMPTWRFLLLAGAAACTAPPETGSGARLSVDSTRRAVVATDADRGALSVVGLDTGTVGEVPVGSAPARVLRRGDDLYVSLRGERAVVRVDAAQQVAQRIHVGAEPIGLATDGTSLFVAASLANQVEEIALASAEITRAFAIPGQPRALAMHPSGQTLFVSTELGGVKQVTLSTGEVSPVWLPIVQGLSATFTLRITGDLVVSPAGERLSVPVLLMDADSSLDAPADENGGSSYAVTKSGEPRFLPAIADLELSDDGQPTGTVTMTRLAADFTTRGQATAIAYDGAGDTLWVTFEGEDGVYALPGAPALRLGFQVMPGTAYADGIAEIAAGRTVTVSTLTRAVTVIDPQGVQQSATALLPSPLGADALRGRMLFTRADDDTMSGGGLSCATCHFEGRADGMTWRFERGFRQTPSLAEKVAERAPLRWDGDRVSVAEDTEKTALVMGGRGITPDDATAVATFVDTIRGVDLPRHGVTLAAGRAVFERAGCAGCHAGALFTDREKHALAGREAVQTPSLIGVAATPPYLFDGTADTLEALVAGATLSRHGAAVPLSHEENAALVEYLESL